MNPLVDPSSPHPPLLAQLRAQAGLRQVVEAVTRVLGLPVDVLVTGESGTGKELIARLLHEADPVRCDGPLIPVNCAALPASLLEADLFGFRRGAFTGADADRDGLFQQAQGGTLFLDEVGELPPALQPKLLRALQERRVRPVGGVAEAPVDVRVVSATNRELTAAMADGAFRRDLYFRLADYVIHVPPLRERLGDVPRLAEYFLRRYRQDFGCSHIRRLSPGARDWLCHCDWRANNVRELSVVMKRAVLRCDGPVLTVEHLRHVHETAASRAPAPLGDDRAVLETALRRCGGNVAAAARDLGLKRSTFYDRLRRHGIHRTDVVRDAAG